MTYEADSMLPEGQRIRVIPGSALYRFLQQRNLQWSGPPELGVTQQEITEKIRSPLQSSIDMTYNALVSKTLKLIRQ